MTEEIHAQRDVTKKLATAYGELIFHVNNLMANLHPETTEQLEAYTRDYKAIKKNIEDSIYIIGGKRGE